MKLSSLSKCLALFCTGVYCSVLYSVQTYSHDTFDNLVSFTAADTDNDVHIVDGYDYCLCGITSAITCATISAKTFLPSGLSFLLPLGSCIFHVGYRAAHYLTHIQITTDRRYHTPYHELGTHSDSNEEIEE